MKTKTDILKDLEGGIRAFADNVGEMFRAAITAFGGLLIAEMLGVAELEERGG